MNSQAYVSRNFSTDEKVNEDSDVGLASGKFVNFACVDDLDDIETKQDWVIKACRDMGTDFSPPYIVLDLAEMENLPMEVDGKKYAESEDYKDGEKPALTPEHNKNSTAKILLSCQDIVDLRTITGLKGAGSSIIKVNPCVPAPYWFQAANLLLKHFDQKGRVIPFAIDQDENPHGPGQKRVTYQFLRVNMQEYSQYIKVLEYGCSVMEMKEAFDGAARFSYEVLKQRGVTEVSDAILDQILTSVMLKSEARMKGVLIANLIHEDIEDLKDSHSIYY